jgi:hypothetical protein
MTEQLPQIRGEAGQRTWPFEGRGEPREPFRSPEDFVARRRAPVQAVVVRIGLHDAQLVLVDADGLWERWVYPTEEEAVEAARDLGLPTHTGQYPEEVRAAMSAFVRSREDFGRGAYPEQGRVGPVNSYPENRPRPVEAEEVPGEAPPAAGGS